MKVMSVLFGRWKGAKITTEHPMHVLRAYLCRSLRYGQIRPTHMEVYRAAHTFLGGRRPSPRTCSPTVKDEARHTDQCRYFN
ncbi:hypothetical protein CFP56_041559 [Quercus suber]|uniref:Uncharacterized protein n=1 Tax=Quercus suber TaxID=58331 RepID=A0AAW0IUT7_QUESU